MLKMHIAIVNASYVGEYKIDIRFTDSTRQQVDFRPFLKSASIPMTRRYLDAKRFQQFQVLKGELDWGDFELCFPVSQLYAGNIALGLA